MSLTMIMGQATTFNEDIKAYYHAPLKEYDFEKKIKESNYTANLDSLKKAFELATKRVKPKDEFEANSMNDTIYFKETGRMFFCKDGTSDAYVKRGLDSDLDSYFERQEINKKTWRIETSTTYIDFVAGGKVFIGEDEWTIIRAINLFAGSGIENSLKGRPNVNLLRKWTVKILILA